MGLSSHRFACLMVIMVLLLVGCGLKDDLYLPDHAPNQTERQK